jgi:hypothetical protein
MADESVLLRGRRLDCGWTSAHVRTKSTPSIHNPIFVLVGQIELVALESYKVGHWDKVTNSNS